MVSREWLARLKRRFNPRLHPLLAVGIGLGLVVLFLPSGHERGEHHSDEEILARLVAEQPDFDHGPGFWLGELRRESELAARARQLCALAEHVERPGCRLLALLERAGREQPGEVDLGTFVVPPPGGEVAPLPEEAPATGEPPALGDAPATGSASDPEADDRHTRDRAPAPPAPAAPPSYLDSTTFLPPDAPTPSAPGFAVDGRSAALAPPRLAVSTPTGNEVP